MQPGESSLPPVCIPQWASPAYRARAGSDAAAHRTKDVAVGDGQAALLGGCRMTKNIGKAERIIRVVLGIGILPYPVAGWGLTRVPAF